MVGKLKCADASAHTTLLFEKEIDLMDRRMIVGIPYIEQNKDNDVGYPPLANMFAGLHALEHFYVSKTSFPKKNLLT